MASAAAADDRRYCLSLAVSTASSALQSGQAQRGSPTGTLRSAPHAPQGSRAPRTSAAPRGSGSAFRRGGFGMSSGGSDCGVAQSGQMNSVRPRSTSSVSPQPTQGTSSDSASAAADAAGGGGAIALRRGLNRGGLRFAALEKNGGFLRETFDLGFL